MLPRDMQPKAEQRAEIFNPPKKRRTSPALRKIPKFWNTDDEVEKDNHP